MLDSKILKSFHQRAVIMTVALLNGCVMFGLVTYYFTTQKQEAAQNVELLRMISWGVGALLIVASFALKPFVIHSLFPQGTRELESMLIGSRLLTATLIILAVVEGPVLLGLVVTFLSRNPQDLIFPAVMIVLGFGGHFPRYSDWENWARGR